jgi:hypothetical protein
VLKCRAVPQLEDEVGEFLLGGRVVCCCCGDGYDGFTDSPEVRFEFRGILGIHEGVFGGFAEGLESGGEGLGRGREEIGKCAVFMRVFDLVVEVEGVHGDCLCFGMILGLVAGVGM